MEFAGMLIDGLVTIGIQNMPVIYQQSYDESILRSNGWRKSEHQGATYSAWVTEAAKYEIDQ